MKLFHAWISQQFFGIKRVNVMVLLEQNRELTYLKKTLVQQAWIWTFCKLVTLSRFSDFYSRNFRDFHNFGIIALTASKSRRRVFEPFSLNILMVEIAKTGKKRGKGILRTPLSNILDTPLKSASSVEGWKKKARDTHTHVRICVLKLGKLPLLS